MKKQLLLIVGLVISIAACGQFSSERQALNRLQKGKWKSADEVLRKALRKDTVNAALDFIFSWYYTESANPNADVDSAYHYALLAIRNYSRSDVRERERLARFPI